MKNEIKRFVDRHHRRGTLAGKILFALHREIWKAMLMLRLALRNPFFNYIKVYRKIDEKKLGLVLLPFWGRDYLKDALEVFGGLGVRPFLVAGTLLGYYREGTFIDGDDDIDLAVPQADWPKMNAFKAEMQKRGYVTVVENQYHVVFRKSDLNLFIDFTLYFRDQDKWKIISTTTEKFSLNEFNLDIIAGGVREAQFLGLNVFVPSRLEEYLEMTYGDWRTARPKGTYENPNKTCVPRDEGGRERSVDVAPPGRDKNPF